MSVATRERSGMVSRAAWYQLHEGEGYSIQTLYDAWGGYDPGENVRTLNRIWYEGAMARAAGTRATGDRAAGTVPMGDIPGRGVGFRYTVLGYYAPSNGGPIQPRTFTFDSPFQASLAALTIEAQSRAPNAVQNESPPRPGRDTTITYTLDRIEVYSLERW